MELSEALATVKQSRNKTEAVRDALDAVRGQLDVDDEADNNYLQRLFESAFLDTVMGMSLASRHAIYDQAVYAGGPILNIFNEYASFMELAHLVKVSENTNFVRPGNAFAAQVAEANNPISTAYSLLRKNKGLSENQVVTILEAAFPIATNGLDKETRDYLYSLAADRGVTKVEIANAYTELVDLVTSVRFVVDSDSYSPESELED